MSSPTFTFLVFSHLRLGFGAVSAEMMVSTVPGKTVVLLNVPMR